MTAERRGGGEHNFCITLFDQIIFNFETLLLLQPQAVYGNGSIQDNSESVTNSELDPQDWGSAPHVHNAL